MQQRACHAISAHIIQNEIDIVNIQTIHLCMPIKLVFLSIYLYVNNVVKKRREEQEAISL